MVMPPHLLPEKWRSQFEQKPNHSGGEGLEMILRAILSNHLYVCLQPNLVFLFFSLKNPLPPKLQYFLLLETQFPYPLSMIKVWLSFQH